jgi:hypothetical protein
MPFPNYDLVPVPSIWNDDILCDLDFSGLLQPPTITGELVEGNVLTYDLGCNRAYIEWRLVNDTTGAYSVVASGVDAQYLVTAGAVSGSTSIVAVGRCPDPSSPTGYGPEIVSPPLRIAFDVTLYGWFRWTGTLRKQNNFEPGCFDLSSQQVKSLWKPNDGDNYGLVCYQAGTVFGGPDWPGNGCGAPWVANRTLYIPVGGGTNAQNIGYITDRYSNAFNRMLDFGGAVGYYECNPIMATTVGGKWEFVNSQFEPSVNTVATAEWAGVLE